jgi:hypothetical protein
VASGAIPDTRDVRLSAHASVASQHIPSKHTIIVIMTVRACSDQSELDEHIRVVPRSVQPASRPEIIFF